MELHLPCAVEPADRLIVDDEDQRGGAVVRLAIRQEGRTCVVFLKVAQVFDLHDWLTTRIPRPAPDSTITNPDDAAGPVLPIRSDEWELNDHSPGNATEDPQRPWWLIGIFPVGESGCCFIWARRRVARGI